VLDEHLDVALATVGIAALAQGRHAQRDHVQAVVEVLTEGPLLHHGAEVAVGRRHDAHVDLLGLGATDRHERPFLDDAKDLHLERGRHVTHLVHEEGASVGHLEEARLVRDGAREGAATVPEELALEEVVVERAAVRGDEGLGGAPRELVDALGDELLARAVLSEHEHRRVALLDALERLEERHHRRALADDHGMRTRSLLLLVEKALDLAHRRRRGPLRRRFVVGRAGDIHRQSCARR
jgi:hypothetical protein